MKSSNTGSINKFLSFLLIAILLIFVVGFAANGWQETLGKPENGENGDTTDNTDENIDGPDDTKDPVEDTPVQDNNETDNVVPPPIQEPIYINTMTGLEVTKEESESLPLGFVIDPSAPMYGVSNSDLTIEFPMEDGTTRMLSYTTATSALWKIGSLVETRAFISGMSNFFGGIIVSYGNDDMIKYSAIDTEKYELDLSKYNGSYFLENALYRYTSKEKIDFAKTQATKLQPTAYKSNPFIFTESEIVKGTREASSIIIPYSESAGTELYYSEKTGRYLYYKSGNRKVDMLSGKNITYDNVFILFANATTYEKADGSELVMDTYSGGKGYYATKGTLSEITWSVNENGELCFYSLSGEKLVTNTGNSYIAYYKASCSSKVKAN